MVEVLYYLSLTRITFGQGILKRLKKVEKQFTRALTLEANLSTKPGLPQARGSKRNDILVVLKVNVQDLIVIIIIRSRLTEQYVPIDL